MYRNPISLEEGLVDFNSIIDFNALERFVWIIRMNDSDRALVAALDLREGVIKNDESIDVNRYDSSAIFTAVNDADYLGMIKSVLEDDIDVNIKNEQGLTPLIKAASLNSQCIANLLIQKGADVNETDNRGFTPLMVAAQKGLTYEFALPLLKANADINAKTNDGLSALMLAAREGHVDIVELFLLSKCIDVNAMTTQGTTALMFARQRKQDKVVKLLEKRLGHSNNADHIKAVPVPSDLDKEILDQFPTQVDPAVCLQDVKNYRNFLVKEYSLAAEIADKIGDEVLMEWLNKLYIKPDDKVKPTPIRGWLGPVFTMSTLPKVQYMLEVTHPYVSADLAMAASASLNEAPKAQAEAFINIFDNENLILRKVDKNMGCPIDILEQNGLLKALGLEERADAIMMDVWSEFRNKCHSIINSEMAVIADLEVQFGQLSNFMATAHTFIEQVEDHLNRITVQTYSAIVPNFARDTIGPFITGYYNKRSIEAANCSVTCEP